MIADRRPLSTSDPLAFDAPCRGCNYNLRGLAGDPVRCPECGREHARAELEPLYGLRARFRELKGAGDAMLLGIIGVLGGVFLLTSNGAIAMGLPVLAVGAFLIHQSLSACARIMPAYAEWRTALSQYVGWTCALALVPVGIWAVFSVLIWRLTTPFAAIRAGATIDPVPLVGGFALTLPVLFFLRPNRWIRWRQRRAFGRLVRMLKQK